MTEKNREAAVFEYSAYWIAGFLCRTIPLHFAYWLSLRISDCYYFFERRGRCAVIANLRQVMAFRGCHPTERELKLTARTTFQFFGKYLVDFLRFQRLGEEDIKRLVTIEHPEYIEQSWQRGKGVIVVTAHLGNWEIGGAVLAGMGYPLNVVALKQPSAKLNEFFQKHRRKRGMVVVPLGSSVKRLIGALRRKEFIALLADRDYSDHQEATRLCGAPACMPRGASWLAARTGAVVLPGFVLRNEDNTFLMKMYPPIIPVAGMKQEAIQERINAALEDAIGAYPHQWFMFQSVWGGQSYGEAGKSGTTLLNPLPQGERKAGHQELPLPSGERAGVRVSSQ
jgi:lauroyl/myristoyl acyltransferase